MNRSLSLKLTLLLCAVCSVSAWADESAPASVPGPNPARLRERFARADVNGDGQLTLQEAQQGMPRVAKHFSAIDVDHKGYITLAQLQDFVASRAAARASRAAAQTGGSEP